MCKMESTFRFMILHFHSLIGPALHLPH